MADDPISESHFVAVAEVTSLPPGRTQRVTVEGHAVLLVRSGNTVVACQGTCPHEKAGLAQGRVDGRRLVCPRHLASFSLVDGQPSAGWDKVAPLRLYPARVEGERIAVDVEAIRRNPPAGVQKVWDLTRVNT